LRQLIRQGFVRPKPDRQRKGDRRLSVKPLRFWDLALYAVAMTLSLRWLSVAAAAGPASLPMWIAAVISFMAPLVIATAAMVSRFEGEGGIYIWTREPFGPFAGFVCGWLYWTCNIPFFSGLLVFIVNVLAVAAGPRRWLCCRTRRCSWPSRS
jgi:amino acid transporter